jgi:adenosine deaminase
MYPTPADHPVGMLYRAGFAVTLSSDNRLMSATRPSAEFALVAEYHGFTARDLEAVTLNAARSAFCDEETRGRVLAAVEAGYR